MSVFRTFFRIAKWPFWKVVYTSNVWKGHLCKTYSKRPRVLRPKLHRLGVTGAQLSLKWGNSRPSWEGPGQTELGKSRLTETPQSLRTLVSHEFWRTQPQMERQEPFRPKAWSERRLESWGHAEVQKKPVKKRVEGPSAVHAGMLRLFGIWAWGALRVNLEEINELILKTKTI